MQKDALIKYLEKSITLSIEDKKLIDEAYKPLYLDKKEMLYKQGELCNREAFVLSGTLRSYYVDKAGIEHVLNFALPNWWVGDLASFYQGTLATTNVQAIEASELLVIDPITKENLFKEVPALERFFRLVIQKHLSSLQNRFLSTVSDSAEERYKNLVQKIPSIEQLVPQYQIASYLGILPESLSRIKRSMLDR